MTNAIAPNSIFTKRNAIVPHKTITACTGGLHCVVAFWFAGL